MDSGDTIPEVALDFSPRLIIYKNGTVKRLMGNKVVPPSLDPKTNVDSKDVLYSHENGLTVRLYIPAKVANETSHHLHQKLPLLVYFHGGAFCIESALSPTYHNYLNSLVSKANIIAVSVDYRRAPENPIPSAHNDSWDALKWVGSHVNGTGPEDWLNSFADFDRVFLSGDSAGANIAHHMGIKFGEQDLGFNLEAIILFHPYFWGTEPVRDETRDLKKRGYIQRLWRLACPTTSGCDDTWINPVSSGVDRLAKMGCKRMVVFVAEKDLLRDRGWFYSEKLKESGWNGVVEVVESPGEDHVFHLFNPICQNAVALQGKVVSFFNSRG